MRHLASFIALALLAAACAHAPPRSESAGGPSPVPETPPAPTPGVGAEPSPPAQPPPPAEIVFEAVGDIMLGSAFPEPGNLPPGDGAALLREVAPILRGGDVAFGNLEGPLADEGSSTKCRPRSEGRCYAFRVPTRYGRWLKEAGFTILSLANNHAGDFGPAGRQSTRRTLDDLGIAHSGEPGDVARLTVHGLRLALVAFATSDATHDLRDLDAARRLVAELASASDIVVVSMHGGAEGAARQHVPHGVEEFLGEDRGDLRTFTHAMVDAGAALVVGSGPHVVRGMEIHRGRLIAYSLGNFATYGAFNLSGPNGLSLILEVRLGPDGAFRSGRIHPARQAKPGGPRLDPAGEVIPLVRQLSREDFGASAVLVGDDGALTAPPLEPTAAAPAR